MGIVEFIATVTLKPWQRQLTTMESTKAMLRSGPTQKTVLLGAPIGDLIFCAKFISSLRSKIHDLLSRLQQIGPKDPQVAYLLLRFCGSFCKLVHLARSTPPSLVAEASFFNSDIRRCFTECTSVDVSDIAWHQAQLSPSRGGLGLHSLYHHSSACLIASISQSGIALGENHHFRELLRKQEGNFKFWTTEVEPIMRSHLICVGSAINLSVTPLTQAPSQPVPVTTSQPVPATTSQPVPATTSQPVSHHIPACTSHHISACTSQPLPATTSQPIPVTTSQPVPATTTSQPVPATTS